jgi:hypothetical protein
LYPLAPLLGRGRVIDYNSSSTDYAPQHHRDTPSPAELWDHFAYAVALSDRVRDAKDGGPRCVVFDLDCEKPGGRATALRDCARPAAWRAGAGRAFVVDESSTGGRHGYVPLDHRRPPGETLPGPKDRHREELRLPMSA